MAGVAAHSVGHGQSRGRGQVADGRSISVVAFASEGAAAEGRARIKEEEPMSPACQYISDATDVLVEELDALISRHFAAERTIRVAVSDGGWYCALVDDALIFPPTPNLDTVIRFVRAFAIQTAGVVVDEGSVERYRHSVRVGALSERGASAAGRLLSGSDNPTGRRSAGERQGGQPRSESASNVVPIRTPA